MEGRPSMAFQKSVNKMIGMNQMKKIFDPIGENY